MRKLIFIIILSVFLYGPPEPRRLKIRGAYNLDFLQFLVAAESDHISDAVNPKTGATGIGQILPGNYGALSHYNWVNNAEYTAADMLDPIKCSVVMTWYIILCLDEFNGDRILAANAYNAGITGTRNGNILYNYLYKIFGRYEVNRYFILKGLKTNVQKD